MKPNFHWGYVFLKVDGPVPFEARMDAISNAIEMRYNGDKNRELKRPDYYCRVSTKGEYAVLEGCGGQKFDAVVAVDEGVFELSFLVSDQTHTTNTIRDIVKKQVKRPTNHALN